MQEGSGLRLIHLTTVPMSLRFLSGQVAFMRARGIEVSAVSSPGNELRSFAERERVPVFAVEMHRRITPGRDLGALARIVAHLRRERPDIVHSHTPKGGLLGMIGAWLAGVPVRVYHMRGLPMMTATGAKRTLLRLTERIACSLAHEVFCVSHSLRGVAIAERLCAPEKIRVFLGGSGNGVDSEERFNPSRLDPGTGARVRERLEIPTDATVVGFVGRIVRDKGVAELAAAWTGLREEFADAHLLMVGPFEEQDPIGSDIREALQSDPRVHLVGEEWDVSPLYAAMDLVVLPTYREGFPNVPLEAAAMGLPVVATRIPGCTDAVQDGVTGVLVPARDSASLAAAIRTYVASPELRREHGRRGRERVEREFSREEIWEAIFQAYLRLARERGVTASRGRLGALRAVREGEQVG